MRNSTKRLAIGSLIGAAVGYVAGLLTAPKSGRETRKDIQQAAVKAKATAEKQLKALHSELDDLIKKGTTKAKQLKSTAQKELIEAIAKAQLTKEKARQILSAIHEGDADDTDLKKAVTEASKSVKHLKKYLVKKTA
ncbi:YtxH domain-containing protein [Candidatus Saccharibacteria bacterium]|nr:YtxH domain-containing protein [Candidatus Saccharibacteria bacterium]